MFESLSDRLNSVFKDLTGKGRLNETNVEDALKQVRLALLEADVNFRVVKDFIARIRERALGEEVLGSLSPAQQVIKIVNDNLIALLGEQPVPLNIAPQSPSIIMLVGLQGSGKTTTAAKLALNLRKKGSRPLLVAADIYRPAAVAQLESLGKQLDIPVHSEGTQVNPIDICRNGIARARAENKDYVILDTAGRLYIDEGMMKELMNVRDTVHPSDILLVADSQTGQEAVRIAEEFNQQIGLSGLILTKIDGDARGGAALSLRAVTGVPIKFIGTGEKVDALEQFYPDRMASRILGMGDVLSLIEKAQVDFDEVQAKEMQRKLRTATFNLNDFLDQMKKIRKLGPLQDIMAMIPGLGNVMRQNNIVVDEKELSRIEGIIHSMTNYERENPEVINGSRRKRVAAGCGMNVSDVNALLLQFKEMQKMMKDFTNTQGRGGKMGAMRNLMRGGFGGDPSSLTSLPGADPNDEEAAGGYWGGGKPSGGGKGYGRTGWEGLSSAPKQGPSTGRHKNAKKKKR